MSSGPPKKKNRFLRYLASAGAGSMLVSIIVHVVVLGGATVYVVSTVQEQRKAAFQGGTPAGGGERKAVEHSVKMSRQQQNLSQVTQRLAVDSPNAAVSLPDLPDLPGMSSGGGPALGGSLGGAGAGTGGGGNGPSMSRGPLMPAFGFREAQPGGTLVGTLYDFKQLRTRKRNPDYTGNIDAGLDMPTGAFATREIQKFLKANWATNTLYKFYQAPNPLFATQVFVPNMQAAEAPKAYGVANEIKSKAWVAVYRGRVSPPKNGVYRFVGGGDDHLLVRLDGRLVLDGSIGQTAKTPTDRPDKPFYAGVPGTAVSRLTVGKRMELRAGQFYDIAILVCEGPGGIFSSFLLFEEEGVTYEKAGNGDPILPIFRVADANVKMEGRHPRFMANGPVWRALPAPK